ncbi:uncharacterized protein Z519_03505 [Cladophialophora bantiana CBS 173.52]|uniref:Uncharacterized protein n=1 Tax=Cladophialophora bantiana (strain ATCC 10958 / CBS 173.52 / CDC B-1940 / NIH 8579) TaxID=1442370 RepID=A0A0D2F2L8_CLAB1|nr:uncharacterized protein Z519_03505 [Cladophialophora bantiana CBS 173.52]KIW96436.1 hypothetical protein Z519_03505 [Cladophialophora bantiana CBS 173.52]
MLPLRRAPTHGRKWPDGALPGRILPIVEEFDKSTQSTRPAQDRVLHGRITKNEVVKSANVDESPKVSAGTKESGSPWLDTLETKDECFQEEIQRYGREGEGRDSDGTPEKGMTMTTAEIPIPVRLHVAFK